MPDDKDDTNFFSKALYKVGDFFTGNDRKEEKIVQEDLRKAQEAHAELQKNHLEAIEKLSASNSQRRDALKRSELSETLGMETRADKMRESILAQQEAVKSANSKREDELTRAMAADKVQAENRDAEALRKQKDAEAAERLTREKNDQDLRKQFQENNSKAEQKNEENIKAMNNEKAKLQKDTYDAKKQFGDQIQQTSDTNFAKLCEEKEKTAEVMKGNALNQLAHNSLMNTLERISNFSQIHVDSAHEKDTSETLFIAAVKNTIKAGRAVPKVVDSLAAPVLKLGRGKSTSGSDGTGICQIIVSKIHSKLGSLEASCEEILNCEEKTHSMVVEVQNHIRDVQDIMKNITSRLTEFEDSLTKTPIENAKELFKNVQQESSSLYKKINKVPVITESNHAVNYLKKKTEALALGTEDEMKKIAELNGGQASLEDENDDVPDDEQAVNEKVSIESVNCENSE